MAFKQCLVGIKRPKVCQETFPIWRHHHQHWPKLLTKDKFWIHLFKPLMPNSEPTLCILQQKSTNIKPTYFQCFNIFPMLQTSRFGKLSSAVVAPPPQDSIGSYRVILRLRCFSDSGVRRVIIWVTIGFLSMFDPKIYRAFHWNLNNLFLWHVLYFFKRREPQYLCFHNVLWRLWLKYIFSSVFILHCIHKLQFSYI